MDPCSPHSLLLLQQTSHSASLMESACVKHRVGPNQRLERTARQTRRFAARNWATCAPDAAAADCLPQASLLPGQLHACFGLKYAAGLKKAGGCGDGSNATADAP
jgi:hypothetical protein